MPELFSLQFLLFLFLFFLIYYVLGKYKPSYQWIVLLCASIVFYAWAGIAYFLFLLLTSLCSYGAGRYFASLQNTTFEKSAVQKKKKLVLILVLLVHFGILFLFKYTNIMQTTFSLVLPLGLSYYTFQSISYLVDTYNEKIEPETNFFHYLLFISYFPQLLQGPINRYAQMKDQFFQTHHFDLEQVRKGLVRFGYGIIKKYAIANMLVATWTHIFTQVDGQIEGSVVVFGILVYAFWQYADFSGGIDMVLGVSELFGIEMMENFRQPYFAVSLADFWRRWHISLGAWMKDYVFYPLALSKPMRSLTQMLRKKTGPHWSRSIPAGIANIVVFFLVGLWHGADTHFLVWGLWNGLVIAISDCCAPLYKKINLPKKNFGVRVFQIIRTFILVNIGWYFDAIERFKDSLICLKNTVTNFHLSKLGQEILYYQIPYRRENYLIALVCLCFVFYISIQKERGIDIRSRFLNRPLLIRLFVYVLFGILVWMAFPFASEAGGFMYANF